MQEKKLINKKTVLIVLITFLFLSCSKQGKSKTDLNKTQEVGFKNNQTDTIIKDKKETVAIWTYDCMLDTIIQERPVGKDTLTADKLINIVNTKYKDKVQLDLVNISNDTIYVKIGNSEYLTQQMGTSGADEYMISTTFTLTELTRIHFVNFDFEYGDHASPGTYYRKYYWDWINKNKELNKQ